MRRTAGHVGGILPGAGHIPRRHRLEHEQAVEEAVSAATAQAVTSIQASSTSPPITGPITIGGKGGATVSNQGNTITVDVSQLTTLIQSIVNGDIGGMIPKGLIALWDLQNGDVPAGWEVVNLPANDPYLRLASSLSNSLAGTGTLKHSHPVTIGKDSLTTEAGDTSVCIQQGTGSTSQVSLASHVHKAPNSDDTFDTGAPSDDLYWVSLVPIKKL